MFLTQLTRNSTQCHGLEVAVLRTSNADVASTEIRRSVASIRAVSRARTLLEGFDEMMFDAQQLALNYLSPESHGLPLNKSRYFRHFARWVDVIELKTLTRPAFDTDTTKELPCLSKTTGPPVLDVVRMRRVPPLERLGPRNGVMRNESVGHALRSVRCVDKPTVQRTDLQLSDCTTAQLDQLPTT